MKILNLLDAEYNKDYFIEDIKTDDEKIKLRLNDLGFLKNEKIKLLNNNYGKTTFLVKVMGVNYAVDKNVCEEIYIKDE